MIWGRGHNVGLYWLEQSNQAGGNRSWTLHAIDTSWSQPHSPLLADIDGDGRDDLVAGKRFLSHDGKDPGEYDPLVVFWYGFDATTKTWQRHLVSAGGGCGLDLDPKCVDIDGDGDIDILTSARSGLFLLENMRLWCAALNRRRSRRRRGRRVTRTYSRLLVFRDSDGQLQPVQSPLDWGTRRQHILENMQRVMGPLPGPPQRVPLDVQVLERTETDSYVQQKITYAAEPGDRVPAFLLLPKQLLQARRSDAVPAPDQPAGKGPAGRHRRHSHAVLCPRVGRAWVRLPGSGLSQFRRVPVRFQNGGGPLRQRHDERHLEPCPRPGRAWNRCPRWIATGSAASGIRWADTIRCSWRRSISASGRSSPAAGSTRSRTTTAATCKAGPATVTCPRSATITAATRNACRSIFTRSWGPWLHGPCLSTRR